MSVVDDSRKLVQDFLAPELRTIAARLDALEKWYDSLDHKVDDVDRRAEKRHEHLSSRLDEFDRKADRRHDDMMTELRKVSDTSELKERVARLEERDSFGRSQ